MVVYQVYPRSFADADGDGVGDLAGITSRLDHVKDLGCDAVWLSPIFASPGADGGYDVSDYDAIDPVFGTQADFDALAARCRALGLKLLLDVVPCHTSIEHPWFTEHPERYVWSDRDGPQNGWVASFGGPAWSPDPHGRGWYGHSFYPEQPDLDWRHPDVPPAMQAVLRTWRDRGADGFRLDALQRLLKDPQRRDDPPATHPPVLPTNDEDAAFDPVHSRNAPDVGRAVAQLREGAGDDAWLVGEAYVPTKDLGPYLEHLDACFAFELFHADWTADAINAAIAPADGRLAWVLSNHDFPRLADRVGPEHVAAATLLLLTLPGAAFLYQGDELAMADGPDRQIDRFGRDRHRGPMRWDATQPNGGFTTGTPWLPATDGPGVAQRPPQLQLVRDLIALRRSLADEFSLLDLPGLVAYRRGEHVCAINPSADEAPLPGGTVVLHTHGRTDATSLRSGEGLVFVA